MYLADIFGDHMVLQRNQNICVFGYGRGEGTIEFCGDYIDFVSNEEKFIVYLPPRPEGGPYEMRVTLNGEQRVIKDIMIGEVYIAGGQSNMAYPLGETCDIEFVENTNIRFFTEPVIPDEDAIIHRSSDNWIVCEGVEVSAFSAIGYYFAVELQKHIGVPVGIVSCSTGASRIDAWTAPEYVKESRYQEMIAHRHYDYNAYKFNQNSWLYKNKLLNIVPYTNSGVLWYQGESNRCHEEGIHYAALIEIMIKNWRILWGYNLPFYCVQLMPFDELATLADWAVIRSQQEYASKHIENVYLVTLVDTGEAKMIHPLKKKKISVALAHAVRNVQFKEDVEYSGPILQDAKKYDDHIELIFSHANGLHIKGDYLYDTYVYNEKNEAFPINCIIKNNVVKIFWESDMVPVKITMGYANAPMHNLYNNSDYLASPFSLILGTG